MQLSATCAHYHPPNTHPRTRPNGLCHSFVISQWGSCGNWDLFKDFLEIPVSPRRFCDLANKVKFPHGSSLFQTLQKHVSWCRTGTTPWEQQHHQITANNRTILSCSFARLLLGVRTKTTHTHTSKYDKNDDNVVAQFQSFISAIISFCQDGWVVPSHPARNPSSASPGRCVLERSWKVQSHVGFCMKKGVRKWKCIGKCSRLDTGRLKIDVWTISFCRAAFHWEENLRFLHFTWIVSNRQNPQIKIWTTLFC